jgi:hypothetical protein
MIYKVSPPHQVALYSLSVLTPCHHHGHLPWSMIEPHLQLHALPLQFKTIVHLIPWAILSLLVLALHQEMIWISTELTFAMGAPIICQGLEFDFGESMYLDYPWHLHHYEELPYHFSGIEAKGTKF